MVVALLVAPDGAVRAQAPVTGPGSPPLPDLRVVAIRVEPDPVPDGAPATIVVLLHNRGTVAASGSMIVAVAHDRRPPFPLPERLEVIRLGGDELREVHFRIASVREKSDYELYAVVDLDDGVGEADETNNVAVGRLRVCDGYDALEVTDGRDNDCDGEVDETTRTGPRPTAVREPMSPVAFARARPRFAYADELRVRLHAANGMYLSAELGGGDAVRADRAEAALWEEFTLLDHDGPPLRHGDLVSFRTHDGVHLIAAEGAGGGGLDARAATLGMSSLFVLVRLGGDGTVSAGDPVALRAASGHWVTAELGGGGSIRVDRDSRGPWESFTIEIIEGVKS